MTNAIVIRLPMPPSVNGLFKNVRGKGRVRTNDYAAWRHLAALQLKQQRPPQMLGAYTLDITFYARDADARRCDLDNLLKPVIDALVEAGVVTDDYYCEAVTARHAVADGALKDGPAVVVITPVMAPDIIKTPTKGARIKAQQHYAALFGAPGEKGRLAHGADA